MQFWTSLSITTLIAVATAANTVNMVSQDSTNRKVIFTPQEGSPELPSIDLTGGSSQVATFPDHWIGNWYTVSEGKEDKPGMLGEVRWDGFSGENYFDVSAIVNPDDHDGVKMLYPKSSKTPMSGCQTFPCDNAYNLPDDIQTLSTPENELECLIGTKSGGAKRRHARQMLYI
ncbi:hypothetical protein V493_01895 [Pseudogymnoascus sp. VKM F-4281 (FW-2241)]|nr:hypothetical protein V493_01895 [Pseudogymnoascus sp. VKM F-4281 (FW-2241)]